MRDRIRGSVTIYGLMNRIDDGRFCDEFPGLLTQWERVTEVLTNCDWLSLDSLAIPWNQDQGRPAATLHLPPNRVFWTFRQLISPRE